MKILHRIGPHKLTTNFNTPQEVAACDDVLSFDGVYTEVYEYRHLLAGKRVVLFVAGNFVGEDNSFDTGEPPGRFCDWYQIFALQRELGAEIGWHSYMHRDLRALPDHDLLNELRVPFSMQYFAYPYGLYDDRVVDAVRAAGFSDAFAAGEHGDGDLFRRRREYL